MQLQKTHLLREINYFLRKSEIMQSVSILLLAHNVFFFFVIMGCKKYR